MRYNYLAILIVFGLLFSACGGKKKKSMAGDDEVTVQDLVDFYPALSLPFSYSDTSFPKKENDSLLISPGIFYKFTPDSTIAKVFGPDAEPKYYPVGRFNNGEEEVYLITRGIAKDKKVLLLSAYDKDRNYISQLPLIRLDKNIKGSVNVTIDNKFNISKNVTRTLPGDIVVQGHDVYILNSSSKKFMLVMTDSLGEASGELINPIDTLPRTQKYAGDYGGKGNLVSFRDGPREGRMHMFIHMKNDEGCEGELKGEVTFTTTTTAEYRQGGDPCVLQFIFTNNNVKIQEVEGCGSRLGTLECTFNGSYTKHKAAKSAGKAGTGTKL